MVIRGRIRGNGRQLADYLLQSPGNDNVSVLEVRGTSQPDSVKYSLIEMSLTSELTNSGKGLYHVQINPAYGEDRQMTRQDWVKAADILEAETGFTGQKRIIVLHEKKGRIHAHAVWERYDHEKGIMLTDSFSRLAQDRARKEMEHSFNHSLTPDRNTRKPDLKAQLTALWTAARTGQEFVNKAADAGIQICKGTQRPYMVVDEAGRSYDLLRQLSGIKTKEVRERLEGIKLMGEKKAIQSVRNLQNAMSLDAVQEKAIDHITQQQEKRGIKEDQKMHFVEVLASMKTEAKEIAGSNRAQEAKQKLQEFKEQFLNNLKVKRPNQDHDHER